MRARLRPEARPGISRASILAGVPGDTDRHSLVPQECGSLALHLALRDGASFIQTHDPDLRKEVVLPDQHNVTKAARALGTTRETLRYRIQKYGITRS